MKKIDMLLLGGIIAVLLSIAALSQLSQNPIVNTIIKNSQITPSVSLEEKDICTTTFYDEAQDVMGNCIYYNNYTSCLNTTGPNTACSQQQTTWNFECKTGSITVTKNNTECRPNKEFIITIENGAATLKKQIDYSDWGPCIYAQENISENSCLVVTCVSLYDGAHLGKFTDCKGGKSCQKFEICENSIIAFYKNSRDDFVEYDPSFYLPELGIKGVGE